MKLKLNLLITLIFLSACSTSSLPPEGPLPFIGGEPIALLNADYVPLQDLPKSKKKLDVAVYDFPDLTGANLKFENGSSLSRAMTQGADALVVNALNGTGGGTWFRVLERRFIDSVLNERRVGASQTNEDRQRNHVKAERDRISKETARIQRDVDAFRKQIEDDYEQARVEKRLDQLPPFNQAIDNLKRYQQDQLSLIPKEVPFSSFKDDKPIADLKTARYLVSGAIISYESDTTSLGRGVRVANTGYVDEERKDIITLNLRFVDAISGEIVSNSTVSQAVISRRDQGDFMNYITVNTILEIEAGIVTNEPRTLALDAAIRLALSNNIKILREKSLLN